MVRVPEPWRHVDDVEQELASEMPYDTSDLIAA